MEPPVQTLINKLVEAFSNYTYTPNKDVRTLMLDFYLLSALPTPTDPKLATALEESRSKLYVYLKANLLPAVFWALSCEFRHIFDRNKPSDLIKFFKGMGGGEAFIRKYSITFAGLNADKKYSKFLDDDTVRKEFPGERDDRRASYQAVKATGVTPEAFVQYSDAAYRKLPWTNMFGGPKWADISEGWLRLYNTPVEDHKKIVPAIDHIYHLQHNTSSVFNKLKEYYKDGGYEWIKRELDFKFNSRNLYDFFKKISGGLRAFSAAVIKDALGQTYEQFLGIKPGYSAPNPDPTEKPAKAPEVVTMSPAKKDADKKGIKPGETFTKDGKEWQVGMTVNYFQGKNKDHVGQDAVIVAKGDGEYIDIKFIKDDYPYHAKPKNLKVVSVPTPPKPAGKFEVGDEVEVDTGSATPYSITKTGSVGKIVAGPNIDMKFNVKFTKVTGGKDVTKDHTFWIDPNHLKHIGGVKEVGTGATIKDFKVGDVVTIIDKVPADKAEAPVFTKGMTKNLGKEGVVTKKYSNGLSVSVDGGPSKVYKPHWLTTTGKTGELPKKASAEATAMVPEGVTPFIITDETGKKYIFYEGQPVKYIGPSVGHTGMMATVVKQSVGGQSRIYIKFEDGSTLSATRPSNVVPVEAPAEKQPETVGPEDKPKKFHEGEVVEIADSGENVPEYSGDTSNFPGYTGKYSSKLGLKDGQLGTVIGTIPSALGSETYYVVKIGEPVNADIFIRAAGLKKHEGPLPKEGAKPAAEQGATPPEVPSDVKFVAETMPEQKMEVGSRVFINPVEGDPKYDTNPLWSDAMTQQKYHYGIVTEIGATGVQVKVDSGDLDLASKKYYWRPEWLKVVPAFKVGDYVKMEDATFLGGTGWIIKVTTGDITVASADKGFNSPDANATGKTGWDIDEEGAKITYPEAVGLIKKLKLLHGWYVDAMELTKIGHAQVSESKLMEEYQGIEALNPRVIYDFYALAYLSQKNMGDMPELQYAMEDIKRSVLAFYRGVIQTQLGKYAERGRYVGNAPDKNTEPYEELLAAMKQTRRGDMQRSNTKWEELIQHLIDLEKTRDTKKIIHAVDRVFNLTHNTNTHILDKFASVQPLIAALNFCHQAKTLQDYKGKVSRPVRALMQELGESVEDINDLINIQKSDPSTETDRYMAGLTNGLIVAKACMTGEDIAEELVDCPCNEEEVEESTAGEVKLSEGWKDKLIAAGVAGSLVVSPMTGSAKTSIDAGHGGKDPGAVHGKTYEKDITSAYALKLKKELPDSELTKTGDVKLNLRQRAGVANAQKSDVLVSFHANSTADPVTTATGVRVLYNQDSVKGKALAEELVAVLGGKVMPRGPEDRGWTLLNASTMPAVIIELGFLNNPEDLKKIQDPKHQDDVVAKVVSVLKKLAYER